MCELAEMKTSNIIRHELLGLSVIVEWKKGDQRRVQGIVVGETKNMIKVKSDGEVLSFPKKACSFIFTLPNDLKVKVDGNVLVGRPEDRLKKVVRGW